VPRVSVLFPAHRVNPFMADALKSLINQSYTDFEVLFLDNSQDGIAEKHWNIDPRIVHVKLDSRFGLAESLNAGIAISTADYLARMDYDDLSLTNRLEKQIMFMDQNLEVCILGTGARVIGLDIDENAKSGNSLRRPLTQQQVIPYLLEKNPLIHPTVMFRRSLFQNSKMRYRNRYDGAEDLDLWTRASHVTSIANLDEELLEYRIHPGQFSREDSINSVQLALRCRIRHAIWVMIKIPGLRKKALKSLVRSTLKFLQVFPTSLKSKSFNKFNESKFE
jgi:glycosyltransferase involved in cell wall biosynthesis